MAEHSRSQNGVASARLCPAIHVLFPLTKTWMPGTRPGMTNGKAGTYFPFPARLKRNTPCSPNMFQNHHGALSRNGRP